VAGAAGQTWLIGFPSSGPLSGSPSDSITIYSGNGPPFPTGLALYQVDAVSNGEITCPTNTFNYDITVTGGTSVTLDTQDSCIVAGMTVYVAVGGMTDPTTAGTYYASVSTSADVTPANGPYTIVTGPAAHVATAFAPASLPAGGTSVSQVTGTVTDTVGNGVAGDKVSFATSGRDCGSLASVSAVTNRAGQATDGYTSATGPGTCTVTATDTTTSVSGAAAIVQFAPTSSLTVTAASARLQATGSSTSPITVQAEDPSQLPVAGDTVELTTSGGACGTLSSPSGVTGASGQVTATYTTSAVAGDCVITATDTTADPVRSATVTIAQTGPPAQVTVTAGNDQSIHAGLNGSPLSVLVSDANGTPVPSVPVTFTAPSAGPSAVFTGTGARTETVFTDVTGTATVSDLQAHWTAGSYRITATAGSAPPAVFTLVNLADSAAFLTLTPSDTEVPADGASTLTVTAFVGDEFNNGVSGESIILGTSGAGACGTLTPSNGSTDATGVVAGTYTASRTPGPGTVSLTV
jgi:hypothetical protein